MAEKYTVGELRNKLKHIMFKAAKSDVDGFITANHMREINRIVDDEMLPFVNRYGIQQRLEEISYIRTQGQRVIVPGFEDRPVFSDAFRERNTELTNQLQRISESW